MKKRRMLALLTCLIVLFSSTLSTFAVGDGKEDADFSGWMPEDFTYVDYEKLLYGCDYTRQFVVFGKAISGFSESGEEKLKQNTDLVIPAVDTEGQQIVGIADNAFKKKGLTSVVFPTGMMVEYEDTITNKVTKRGNFVIGDSAFAGNELTSVYLPEGVIACLTYAFHNNKIETVKLPKTIWWLETMSFAQNKITTVEFPMTCDFQLEMHGLTFAKNLIQSVKLPDYTEVVSKHAFAWNPGKEPIAGSVKDEIKTYTIDGKTYNTGVVYMYADNAEFEEKDRISHTGRATASQKSDFQKLIINYGTEDTKNPDLMWSVDDFTYEGTVVTGFSESGIAKRATTNYLIIPEFNKEGLYVTEIASANPGGYGLFGAENVEFDYVYIPSGVKKIGNYTFQSNGIDEVSLPSRLEMIGNVAFQTNDLTSVILPNTVTSLGNGAFATNPKLERISLSKALTEIAASAFGCSDGKNWMTNLTSIELHEGITTIGSRAFAANNFSKIVLPSTVKTIGSYAFSTKNYLTTPCEVFLNEGLETIAADAFRNKVIHEIKIPITVKNIHKNTFRKEYSDDTPVVVTKVYVSLESQYSDSINFPTSEYHAIYLNDSTTWTADDFTYGTQVFELYPAQEESKKITIDAWVITGFSEEGTKKIAENKNLVIPAQDVDGKKIQGIANGAFKNCGITSLTLPKDVMDSYDDTTWDTTGKGLTERGDFFIGASAFQKNNLTTLQLPDGVIYVGGNAFNSNHLTSVTFPESVMWVANAAFGKNSISKLIFPDATDFAFQVDSMAFAINNIQMVQLPSNTEKLNKWVFLQNTGMEPITSGMEAEMKGGLVYMYMDAETAGPYMDYKSAGSSVVQELFLGTMPDAYTPWKGDDFTYDEAGTTITGLSEKGQDKLKTNPEVALPNLGPTGEAITALGDGENMQGIFVYVEGDKNYAPASVALPDTLTKIGKWTFALNANLTYEGEMREITLPNSLVEIGQTAFQNSKLTSIVIPDSVTTMGSGAFTGSGCLTSVTLSKNLMTIPTSAFNAGSVVDMKLESLIIPEGVKTIEAYAFTGTHVEHLELPSTLTTIGTAAFQNHQLTELTLPSGVTEIGNYAFRLSQEGLEKVMTSLTLNEGLVTIGKEAFLGNAILEVELPSTVVLSAENDSNDAIFGKKNKEAKPIVKLRVADKEKAMLYNTEFANQWSHVVLYDNLVGTDWKYGDFTYEEETGTLTGWSESGQAKRLQVKNLILPEYTPEGVEITTIGEAAFKIPNEEVVVTKFGIDSPNGMTSVVIPKTVTIIEDEAFSQNGLTVVDLTYVTSIGHRAFYGNDLVKVELPDTVTSLGTGAFATNDITELKLSAGVTVIPQGAFSMNIRLDNIEIPDTVTEIGTTAFAGARLTSLEIPASVVKIGEKAFHLHHITELKIPGTVKELGESAFEGTFKATTLKTLILEEGIESIGKNAFKEGLLETVVLPSSLKSLGEGAFSNNKGKDSSQVVELYTNNIEHLVFTDASYNIIYTGQYLISEYEKSTILSYEAISYSGIAAEPKVTIEGLTEGVDYIVAYKNNVNPGTATVEITGMGRYTGTIVKTFIITDNPFVEENEELKSDKEILENENAQLESDKAALENEKAQLESEKEALENEKAQLELDKAALESEMAQLELDKIALENEIAFLKEQLNENHTDSDKEPEEPDVLPEEPDATPDEPDVTPDEPDVTPDEPDVTPDDPDISPDEPDTSPDEEPENNNDSNNKLIIGIVIGAIVGACLTFLLTGKKK